MKLPQEIFWQIMQHRHNSMAIISKPFSYLLNKNKLEIRIKRRQRNLARKAKKYWSIKRALRLKVEIYKEMVQLEKEIWELRKTLNYTWWKF